MASLNTRMPGNPDSIRGVAEWLRRLGGAVGRSTDDTKKVVEESAHRWRDDKADEYRERWDSGGRNAGKLSEQIELYAKAYDKCADALETAQGYVRQARELSTGPPYLEMSGDLILFPEPTEPIPGVSYSDPDDNYEKRILAYREAEQLVHQANDLVYETLAHLRPPPEAKNRPRFFAAADYVNGTTGAMAKAYESHILSKGEQMAARRGLWATAFRSQGGPILAGMIDDLAKADLARAREAAKSYTAIGKTIDLTGKAILGVGVGYDIFVKGEPWDKAILEGTTNYVGGVVGAAAGAALGGYAGARFGAAEDPGSAIAYGAGGIFVGGWFGGKLGGRAGDELYEWLESKTLIDDPGYFK